MYHMMRNDDKSISLYDKNISFDNRMFIGLL